MEKKSACHWALLMFTGRMLLPMSVWARGEIQILWGSCRWQCRTVDWEMAARRSWVWSSCVAELTLCYYDETLPWSRLAAGVAHTVEGIAGDFPLMGGFSFQASVTNDDCWKEWYTSVKDVKRNSHIFLLRVPLIYTFIFLTIFTHFSEGVTSCCFNRACWETEKKTGQISAQALAHL